MNSNLIKARLIAFFYEAGTLIVLGVLGVLSSPEFAQAVTNHFGESVGGSLILLAVSAGVKHVRNMLVMANADLGGDDGEPPVLI